MGQDQRDGSRKQCWCVTGSRLGKPYKVFVYKTVLPKLLHSNPAFPSYLVINNYCFNFDT